MSALSPRGAAGADAVLELFEALQETKIVPNSITYVAAIRAYGDKGNWQKAEQVKGRAAVAIAVAVAIAIAAAGGESVWW